MKTTMTLCAAAVMAISGVAYAAGEHPGHGPHWGYKGDTGPAAWTKLKPEFSACAGKNQSPVNLTGTIDAQLPAVAFNYKAGGTEVVNNGHTIQVNYEAGNGISMDGMQFELKQFHFHSPSENQINGKSFPLEAHLVHADKDGDLAVVSVVFDLGPSNPAVGAAWGQMPKAEGKAALPAKVSAKGLLPANRDYYRYNGSLTTPPCSEGVRWVVMKKPMTISKEQLEAFKTTLGFDNNRPVQPLNARPILR
ncbi:MAG: carbonic anhydrase family protein [Rubrivivax sp.]|jgi:carbonic anhydrase|nr:carbonic anhydrase family protein [Betaproteobacteria bacterium]MBP6462409.1 carbonic anhydrase family protein [Rubrivivax sp.]MBK7275479.1 carbonic anhydrase family protein [Betaproteobacteria bacterium]MBK7458938.1 carbonic anhydrase family protein [Betaproteobacteria bacterium]MBK7514665.1 carbonic anhydrase family protein [Betaproteobacteria bacterium]